MNTVFVKTYPAPVVDMREILRYAGVRDHAPDMVALVKDCLAEVEKSLTYRVCYAKFPVVFGADGVVDIGTARVRSVSLAKHLAGCSSAIVFAATVGLALDRLIARYGTHTPSRAVMLDAIGVERVEALCDDFCRDMAKQMGREMCSRFSPGYGDLPLSYQRDIFFALDIPRRIGVSLNESLLMSPSKSVTAIIGIKA